MRPCCFDKKSELLGFNLSLCHVLHANGNVDGFGEDRLSILTGGSRFCRLYCSDRCTEWLKVAVKLNYKKL